MPKKLKTLGEDVLEYTNAGYPALWIYSNEQEEAVEELRKAIRGDYIPIFARWDGAAGLKVWEENSVRTIDGSEDFSVALEMIQALGVLDAKEKYPYDPEKDKPPSPTRVCSVFLNLQLHINTATKAQELLNYIYLAGDDAYRQRFITLSTQPVPTPEILVPQFTRITHRLPDREQLRVILNGLATEDGDLPEDEEEVEAIIDAARGLTRLEASNAFAHSLATEGEIKAMPVFEKKAVGLKDNGLGLELHKDRTTTLDHVVGLQHIKDYYMEIMGNREKIRDNPRLHPHGIVLAGPPGTGKSLLCSALGNSCVPSRPTIKWRKALTGSKYVSEGAAKMAQVIDILESLAPCNVQVDEGGKSMRASSGDQEGGSAQQAGEMDSLWLEAHQESEADMYPIFTMNQEIIQIANNMPEFLDRFDAVFFLDFPSPEQLDQMWVYHMMLYGLIDHEDGYKEAKENGVIPDCKNWVGRTVDNCCRQAALRGRDPVDCHMSGKGDTAPDAIERLRHAATKHGWLSAEYPEPYDKDRHDKLLAQAVAAVKPKRDTVRGKKKRKVAKT